ncbi:MAG: hypothetical protein OEQ53_06480 [Saprospiraceae bacterium]|nr:hypothetical protein [Saprospiraceae bacterium]
MNAQGESDHLPFAEIPQHPEEYSAESVTARMIEGLGFRYHWATEGLRQEDLEFKPSAEARTSLETLQHIFGLSRTILIPLRSEPILRGSDEKMTFAALREATLMNLKDAADLLRQGKALLKDSPIIFQGANRSSEYPYWNNLNGPIADAIWHVGQVVSFRRSSGNPFDSRVSVFQGKLRGS